MSGSNIQVVYAHSTALHCGAGPPHCRPLHLIPEFGESLGQFILWTRESKDKH